MEAYIPALTIFALALFLGFVVITKVPPLLHTPLMSGSNAISGVALVGTLIVAGQELTTLTTILAFVAIVMSTTCVVGGFMVTHRMLGMFRRRE